MGGENEAATRANAASALAWWLEAGVDVAVQEAPRNWLKPSPAPVAAAPALQIKSHAVPVSNESMPETLDLFRDWLGSAQSLPFATPRAPRVLPSGGENAPVMLLAEMPGPEDAAAGLPIAGDAWILTERMLAAIGIDAAAAYCASLSCFHTPAAQVSGGELEACAVIARRHIALAKPKRLLLLGDAPAKALLGKPLASARGHIHQVEGVRTVATFHPRQLLARPSFKEQAWRDLLLLMEDEA